MTTKRQQVDLLYGAKAIGDHLGLDEKTTRYRIEKRLIPTFKMGAIICATRSGLDKFFAKQMAAAMGGLR